MTKSNSQSVQDYLKRYTDPAPVASDYKVSKKKKKKTKVKKTNGFKVVDVDYNNRVAALSSIKYDESSESSEDHPTVVTIEDDLAEYRPRGTFKSIEIGDDLPRKGNEEDEGDLDLPRRPKNTEDDLELPRKPKQEISEDLAPRRTLGPVKQEPDLDLPRGEDAKRKRADDLELPRKSRKADDGAPIKPEQMDLDLDLPRPPAKKPKPAAPEEERRAGLFTTHEVSLAEEAKAKKQMEELRKQDPRSIGRGAATVYRDARGRPLTMLNAIVTGESEEQNMEWGVGKKTDNSEAQKAHEEDLDDGKGYSGVWKDDPKLNQEAAARVRFGDPMANKLKKQQSARKLKMYTRGFPANRFNIRPGWRWDGIDRSNRYEAKIFQMQNEKQAQAELLMYQGQQDM